MKNRIKTILIICLAASTLLFVFLWQSEKNEKSYKDDVQLLAQSSARSSYEHFVEYQKNGDESSYWYGVADFRAFEQAYQLLIVNTNKNSDYLFCNEVYGLLVLTPEKCQERIADIIETMELLAKDVEDVNGYNKMSSLRNRLREE